MTIMAGRRAARRANTWRAALRIALVLFVLMLAAVTIGTVAGRGRSASAADAVPYNDPRSTGFITLYDKAGKPVKSGSIDDHPFVWKAAGSAKALAPYDGNGRKATLYAFQPRQGADPSTWSGDTLTASTDYTDPAHPTATASTVDFSLQDYLSEFPARWDGLVQLRIYLGVPGQSTYTVRYASTDLKVTGRTWTVVGGGPGAGSGGANIPGTAGAVDSAASGVPNGGAQPLSASGSVAPDSGGSGAGAGDDQIPLSQVLPDIGTPPGLIVAAVALVGLVMVGLLWRRNAAPGQPGRDT
jgi:hypothetical protein